MLQKHVDQQRSPKNLRSKWQKEKDELTLVDLPSPTWEPPRSFTTTLAPLEAKKVAYALPKPPPAPVTTTVWLSKRSSDMVVSSLSSGVRSATGEEAETGSDSQQKQFPPRTAIQRKKKKENKLREDEKGSYGRTDRKMDKEVCSLAGGVGIKD